MRLIVPLVFMLASTTGAAAPLASVPTGGASTTGPLLTGIVPVRLRPGINRVPGFLPDGGTATIVEAWRGNGNAHGYRAWMVLTGPSEGNPVGLAPFETGEQIRDTISDNPFDGERVIGALRFVRARFKGRMASLVVTADLEWTSGRPLADHEHAAITVYRLQRDEQAVGPPVSFVSVAKLQSRKRYCNAELALRDVLGVPLSAGYAGPNRVDGCFD